MSSLAAHFSSNDWMIGYDLMNEPWGYDWELEPLYNQMGEVIDGAFGERVVQHDNAGDVGF